MQLLAERSAARSTVPTMPTPSFTAPSAEHTALAAVSRSTSQHAFVWLALANAVGLLMALLLAWPSLNDLLAPLSYGRWVSVHLNGHLYGWCTVPLIGVALRVFLDPRHPHAARHGNIGLAAWSLALAAGSVSWLAGHSSGKLFMEWSGWMRPALPAAMLVLWPVLAAHTWWRRPSRVSDVLTGRALLAASVLAALLVVPVVFFWAAGATVYPAVNPDSGGATGAALLGSTLGILTLYGALPVVLGRPRHAGTGCTRAYGPRLYVAALVASWLLYSGLNHGAVSHHRLAPQAALGTLLAWVPLTWLHFRAYVWPAATRRWLLSAFACWALLVVDGWLTFLPGFSETLKFTHGLVAHAHLAMAGFITAVNHVMLQCLTPSTDPEDPPIGPSTAVASSMATPGFVLWHVGLVLHFVALIGLFTVERSDVSALFLGSAAAEGWLWLRAAGGGVLLAASVIWLRNAFRP